MNNCLYCQKLTKNAKFCSRSCSAKITNVGRKATRLAKNWNLCALCGEPCSKPKRTKCQKCIDTETARMKQRTLSAYKEHLAKRQKPNRFIHGYVRNFARSWNQKLLSHACWKCGYSKHVELCHIKAVVSFDDSATLGEINSPDNLLVLCPNCHWEFDNGYITIDDIVPRTGHDPVPSELKAPCSAN